MPEKEMNLGMEGFRTSSRWPPRSTCPLKKFPFTLVLPPTLTGRLFWVPCPFWVNKKDSASCCFLCEAHQLLARKNHIDSPRLSCMWLCTHPGPFWKKLAHLHRAQPKCHFLRKTPWSISISGVVCPSHHPLSHFNRAIWVLAPLQMFLLSCLLVKMLVIRPTGIKTDSESKDSGFLLCPCVPAAC